MFKINMSKQMRSMLLYVGILFGIVFGWKLIHTIFIKIVVSEKLSSRIATVSAMKAEDTSWQSTLSSVGSTRTYMGVNITTELSGMVTYINFTAGENVKKGQVLAQLDISQDVAKLHSLEAQAEIAKITYERDLKQYKIGAVSKETIDQDRAQYQSSAADVKEQKATIEMKTIKAPFDGKLGISQIYLGQYLQPGDAVVNIQTLSPIYVDFYLPQQDLPQIVLGQEVSVTADTYPDKTFLGNITTINPEVDSDVRNVEVEATLQNKDGTLLPGMFVNVTMNVGSPSQYVTLPQTAISFNPYGDIAFTLIPTKDKQGTQTIYTANQTFVTTGDRRGNQIAVVKGINQGDMVVTSGELKLVNGSRVVIDNSLAPSDNPDPHPQGQ